MFQDQMLQGLKFSVNLNMAFNGTSAIHQIIQTTKLKNPDLEKQVQFMWIAVHFATGVKGIQPKLW